MSWFRGIKTRNGLKRKFHELAKIHHPDRGGDTAIMQEIAAEYERLCKILPKGASGNGRKKTASSAASAASGGFYPAPVKKTVYSWRQICSFAKTLSTYGKLAVPLKGLYRILCQRIDPGQTRPYCDFPLSLKEARESLKALRKTLTRFFDAEFYRLVRRCETGLGNR